jgi:hypothetical protein
VLDVTRFPQHFLDEIRDKVPVSEVVGRRVDLKRTGREFRGLSPFNQEKTPSFFVNDQKQRWFDFSSNLNGDVFDWLIRAEGLTFPQAVEHLANLAGVAMPQDIRVRGRSAAEQRAWAEEQTRKEAEAEERRRQREIEDAQDDAAIQRLAQSILRSSAPIAATHAEAYLNERGIPTPAMGWPDVLRFKASLNHPSGRSFPALIARVDDCAGELCAIWRIFLDPKKPAKAPLPGEEKLGLGNASGGAVRIGGTAAHTDVGEGLESTLGAWSLAKYARPVWATLSTSGMMNFEPPLIMQRCDIFPDGDYPKRDQEGNLAADPRPAGRKAAQTLRERLNAAGITGVINPEPNPGQDYLDVWNGVKALYVET